MSTNDYTYELRTAHNLGCWHGERAGSWVIDGNTTRETAEWILRGIDDGDPVVDDLMPAPLSGEWADSMTPARLLEELGLQGWDDDDTLDSPLFGLVVAYEEGFAEGFWDVVTKSAQTIAGEES